MEAQPPSQISPPNRRTSLPREAPGDRIFQKIFPGAYGHFSNERAIIVQAADQGDQGTGVMAAFIDRKNPANRYIEAYNFAGGLPF